MFDKSSPFAGRLPPGPTTKRWVACQVLRHVLLVCDIEPGMAFSELELETKYRLTRASVRAALASLAAQGLVMAEPRQGWRAAPVTGALIGDLIAGRRQMEPLLAERMLVPSELSRLEALVMLDAAIIRREDAQAVVVARATNRQIMDILAEGVGHFHRKWLAEVWDHTVRVQQFLERGDVRYRPISRDDLIAALKAKDRDAAVREILREIAHFEAFVGRALLRRPEAIESQQRKKSARRARDRLHPAQGMAEARGSERARRS